MARLGAGRRVNQMLWLRALLVLGLLALAGWVFLKVNRPKLPQDVGPNNGQLAPRLAGTSLTGLTVDLGKMRGKPVVLNFWTPSQLPRHRAMQAEAKLLANLQQHFSEKVSLLGVLYREPAANKAASVAGRYGLLYPTLNDPQGQSAEAYRVSQAPTTFFIDRWGVIRAAEHGPLTRKSLSTGLKTIGVSGY